MLKAAVLKSDQRLLRRTRRPVLPHQACRAAPPIFPPTQPEVVPEGEVAANPTNTQTATTEREQTTRNYELDKEITFVKEQAGRVVSMTAGVIVNEESLRDLAKRRYYASLDEQPAPAGDRTG